MPPAYLPIDKLKPPVPLGRLVSSPPRKACAGGATGWLLRTIWLDVGYFLAGLLPGKLEAEELVAPRAKAPFEALVAVPGMLLPMGLKPDGLSKLAKVAPE